jgi:hypothetical protein
MEMQTDDHPWEVILRAFREINGGPDPAWEEDAGDISAFGVTRDDLGGEG